MRVKPDENVITASIMQERYLNYSPIKRDKQSRLDTIGFSGYPTYPKLYIRAICFLAH